MNEYPALSGVSQLANVPSLQHLRTATTPKIVKSFNQLFT